MATKPHLRIDSHVVIQLGAELISDSEQALLELIKNAYDGDATRCSIVLEPDWNPPEDHQWRSHLESWRLSTKRESVGRIVVRDNGSGLTESAVTDGWLFISASLKRSIAGAKTPTLKRHRIPVGDKGLGRLATMRLGEVLLLRTMTEGESRSRSVSFAWSAFEAGEALEQVDVKTKSAGPLRGRQHGTNVEVLGLLEPQYWATESSINSVISKLSTLISPFEALKDFNVVIRSGEQDHDLQTISAEALNFSASRYEFSYSGEKLRLKAYVAKPLFRGQAGLASRQLFDDLLSDRKVGRLVSFLASHPRLSGKNFVDLHKEEGGWLFSTEEEIEWKDIPRDPKLQGAVDPGPFKGEIFNFTFTDHTKEQLVGANIPLGLLQGMTSIGMFRDGFRVRMSDDWLELSKSMTSGGFYQLRPRNVIGFFAITNKDNPLLVEKSDREGFVDNEAWRGFLVVANRTKKFANDSLEAVRSVYDEFKKLNQSTSAEGSTPTGSESTELLAEQRSKAQDSLRTLIEKNEGLSDRVAETRKKVAALQSGPGASRIATIMDELSEIESQIDEVKGTVELVNAATRTGFAAAGGVASAHEQLEEQNLRLLDAAAVGLSARALVHEINSHLLQLNRSIAAITRANNQAPDERISRALKDISAVVRELKKSISAIDPLVPGSRTLKDSFDFQEAIDLFVKQRAGRMEDAGVEFNLLGEKGAVIRFSRSRFTQILENLLQNSLYWLQEHESEIGKTNKAITVEVDSTGFTWADSAKGIRPAVENTLLDAYVTDKPESKGQGLGLFIVNSFLQAERCSISLLTDRNRFKRRFIFRVNLSGAIKRKS